MSAIKEVSEAESARLSSHVRNELHLFLCNARLASEQKCNGVGRFFNLMSMKKTGHEHEQKWSCIMNESNHVS